MKSLESVTLASWLLKHFTFGRDREALIGDLSEEFQSGRSASWYWRQALSAIGVGALRNSRDYVLALVFSLAWCMFYPAWRLCLARIKLPQTISAELTAIDLPYSSALHGIGEMLPALIFVWLGLFLYLLLRREWASEFSGLRLLASLSISLNVLFMTIIGLQIHLKPSGVGLGDMSNKGLFSNSDLVGLCIPLTLSLFSATVSILPRPHRNSSAPHPG
jgi:hypothetical protein